MYKETVVGKTKDGKELAYRVMDGDALYSIYYKKGGQLPECLSGAWNDPRQIENAIISYVNRYKLSEPDQAKKDYKKNISDSKKRPNKLKHKKTSDAKS